MLNMFRNNIYCCSPNTYPDIRNLMQCAGLNEKIFYFCLPPPPTYITTDILLNGTNTMGFHLTIKCK